MNNDVLIFCRKNLGLIEDIRVFLYQSWAILILLVYIIILLLHGGIQTSIIFIIILLIFYVLFFNYQKKMRVIDKIEFNNRLNIIQIQYHYFFLKSTEAVINYSELSYDYRKKVYARLIIPNTLIFYKNKKFIGEIRIKYHKGWEINDIDKIKELADSICNNANQGLN